MFSMNKSIKMLMLNRQIATETNIDNNPFVKDQSALSASNSASSKKPTELFHDTLRNFIRVSEDNISYLDGYYKS